MRTARVSCRIALVAESRKLWLRLAKYPETGVLLVRALATTCALLVKQVGVIVALGDILGAATKVLQKFVCIVPFIHHFGWATRRGSSPTIIFLFLA